VAVAGGSVWVGERVVVDRLEAGDEGAFLAAVAASRALHHPWVDPPDTPERFRAVMARAQAPEFHPFAVRERATGELVGGVNVSNVILGGFRSAFCGYWAYAAGHGRGLMADGLAAVVRHAFGPLGLHRLEANVQPGNVRSIALAERCGFRREGFSPNYLMVDGAWRDHVRYAITVEDVARLDAGP
jgi:ribosomal-protein-alanine N-acetyltransferase